MVTVTQRKPRVKPSRFIRLALPTFQGNPGVVKITVGKRSTDYWLTTIPSDFGLAFQLVKGDESETYHVNLNGEQSTCECKGFLKWGHCKHVEGLQALRKAGCL